MLKLGRLKLGHLALEKLVHGYTRGTGGMFFLVKKITIGRDTQQALPVISCSLLH